MSTLADACLDSVRSAQPVFAKQDEYWLAYKPAALLRPARGAKDPTGANPICHVSVFFCWLSRIVVLQHWHEVSPLPEWNRICTSVTRHSRLPPHLTEWYWDFDLKPVGTERAGTTDPAKAGALWKLEAEFDCKKMAYLGGVTWEDADRGHLYTRLAGGRKEPAKSPAIQHAKTAKVIH